MKVILHTVLLAKRQGMPLHVHASQSFPTAKEAVTVCKCQSRHQMEAKSSQTAPNYTNVESPKLLANIVSPIVIPRCSILTPHPPHQHHYCHHHHYHHPSVLSLPEVSGLQVSCSAESRVSPHFASLASLGKLVLLAIFGPPLSLHFRATFISCLLARRSPAVRALVAFLDVASSVSPNPGRKILVFLRSLNSFTRSFSLQSRPFSRLVSQPRRTSALPHFQSPTVDGLTVVRAASAL